MLLDTWLRVGEALSLEWPQVKLEPANSATFGYLTVLSGKAKSRKSRNVPLSERVVAMLKRCEPKETGLVFYRADGTPMTDSHLDQQHARIRDLLKLPADFVLHSLRHTFGTLFGKAWSGCLHDRASHEDSKWPGGEIGRRKGLKSPIWSVVVSCYL